MGHEGVNSEFSHNEGSDGWSPGIPSLTLLVNVFLPIWTSIDQRILGTLSTWPPWLPRQDGPRFMHDSVTERNPAFQHLMLSISFRHGAWQLFLLVQVLGCAGYSAWCSLAIFLGCIRLFDAVTNGLCFFSYQCCYNMCSGWSILLLRKGTSKKNCIKINREVPPNGSASFVVKAICVLRDSFRVV